MSSDTDRHNRAIYRAIQIDTHFPLDMCTAGRQSVASVSKVTQLHFHNCMEFVYSNAREEYVMVGDDSICVHPNDVLLIFPHVPHSAATTSQQVEQSQNLTGDTALLYIDDDMLLSQTDAFPNDWQCPELSKSQLSHFYYSQAKYPEICNVVGELLREMNIRKYGWKFCAIARALLLLMLIERAMAVRQAPRIPMMIDRVIQAPHSPIQMSDMYRYSPIEIRPALNYIRENYAERIYLSLLSDLCHLSIASFRRKFKEAMGTTPLDYIHDMRIQKACTMLRGGNASILEVSMSVGFESISSFNRQFLATMGVPPNKYRYAPNKHFEDANMNEMNRGDGSNGGNS